MRSAAESFFEGNRVQFIESILRSGAPPAAAQAIAEFMGRTKRRNCAVVRTRDGKRMSVSRLLEEAHERGVVRGPKRIDVLVHPQWPWHGETIRDLQGGYHYLLNRFLGIKASRKDVNRLVTFWQGRFADLMDALMGRGEEPLVVEYEGGRGDNSRFRYAKSRCVTSNGRKTEAGKSGFLSSSQVAKALDIMDGTHPEDEVVIHGAAFAQCPSSFAGQYLALSRLGILFSDPNRSSEDERMASLALRYGIALSHALRNTRIHLGCLFDTAGKYLALVQGTLKGDECSVEVDMMDGNTVIVPGTIDQIREDFSRLH
jgi:hypothetical protein